MPRRPWGETDSDCLREHPDGPEKPEVEARVAEYRKRKRAKGEKPRDPRRHPDAGPRSYTVVFDFDD